MIREMGQFEQDIDDGIRIFLEIGEYQLGLSYKLGISKSLSFSYTSMGSSASDSARLFIS